MQRIKTLLLIAIKNILILLLLCPIPPTLKPPIHGSPILTKREVIWDFCVSWFYFLRGGKILRFEKNNIITASY
jgi:hypothetical protein